MPARWLFHEGRPGWRIDQLDGTGGNDFKSARLSMVFATAARPPDLITVHLGTNDCSQGYSEDLLERNLAYLLGQPFSQSWHPNNKHNKPRDDQN